MKKLGRPANIEMIKKVKRLRARNLTFREISAILAVKDLKTLHRWAEYQLAELSPVLPN